ncbi:MAG: hypothetical protein H0T45_19285 [Pyrinomonadaceae bacterium]|nr:hypothetical protein [Pyrinomonadaceae bacterium]
MPEDNILATFEQNLRQTRATRNRLAQRLSDVELEAEKLRTELSELDAIANQTETAMLRILSSVLHSAPSSSTPSDAEIEVALRRDEVKPSSPQRAYPSAPRPQLPRLHSEIEVSSDRFYDRTIPQATAMILREGAGPLHVNEIYNRLVEGGFQFTGHNPTISVAVSLNRNRRFRKVAPGTFDLTIRDAAQAS